MKEIVGHAREALFIREKHIPPSLQKDILHKYNLLFFDDKACKKCEFLPDRLGSETKLSPNCESCAAFKGGVQLATNCTLNKKKYLKIPLGDKKNLKEFFLKNNFRLKIKKYHKDIPFSKPINFTGTYRGKYQEEAVKAILKGKRGVIKSPARSGKTVIVAAAICKINKKTLIIASQREWLMGFKETFIGSKTQEPLTTCNPKQIGLCKSYEDFVKYDICLATVQTFHSEKGQKLLRKIRDLYSFIAIDEVHLSAAFKYARALASLNSEYMIGVSATPSRKDKRFSIARNLIGPNLYEAEVSMVRPTIRLVRTGYAVKNKGFTPWVRMVSNLENDKARLKLIAKWAVQDAKNGHMILIPFSQVKPIKKLVTLINRLAGDKIAYPFWGGLTGKNSKGEKLRDVYLQAARKYKIKILVGNAKLLSTGTNIPRASALYEILLSSNAENAEQRFSRVLTPWDEKPPPIIRYFLDDITVRRRCLSSEWYQVMLKTFNPIISEVDKIVMKNYLSGKDKFEKLTL
jgi:superfamily II DNA or RNA helicase